MPGAFSFSFARLVHSFRTSLQWQDSRRRSASTCLQANVTWTVPGHRKVLLFQFTHPITHISGFILGCSQYRLAGAAAARLWVSEGQPWWPSAASPLYQISCSDWPSISGLGLQPEALPCCIQSSRGPGVSWSMMHDWGFDSDWVQLIKYFGKCK